MWPRYSIARAQGCAEYSGPLSQGLIFSPFNQLFPRPLVIWYFTHRREKDRELEEAERGAVFEAKTMIGPEGGRQTTEQTRNCNPQLAILCILCKTREGGPLSIALPSLFYKCLSSEDSGTRGFCDQIRAEDPVHYIPVSKSKPYTDVVKALRSPAVEKLTEFCLPVLLNFVQALTFPPYLFFSSNTS